MNAPALIAEVSTATAESSIVCADAPETPAVLTRQKLLALGVLWPAEVDRICAGEAETQFLVDGFLPAKTVAIAAGDSTIGKSPLMLQLALCVAAGVPFLGMATAKGRVIYFDLENPLPDCKAMRDALVGFLGLAGAPENFLLVPDPTLNLERLIEETQPQLVIIDSVRSYRPDVTEKNAVAGEWLKELRRLSRKFSCVFLLVHHVKKPARNREGNLVEPRLESLPVATWMVEMEGPRAFVNQTDVRIAVERGSDDVALKVKWSRRVRGESPLVSLERVFDENGEAAGYRQLTGIALLNSERREALGRLQDQFSFKQAKAALGRSDDPTNKFLLAAMQAGVVSKLRRGWYQKVTDADATATRVIGVIE